MASYKNGIESRNKIIDSAKKLFYEQGYKNTTMAMIADDAGIQASLAAYYFKKEELLVYIHEDYIFTILRAIEEQVGTWLESSIHRHLIMLQIQYIGIYQDEKTREVYRYIVDNGLLSPKILALVDGYLLDSVDEFGIPMSKEDFAKTIVAQYGAHREMVRVYLKDYDAERCRELLYFTGTIALRLAGVDPRQIEVAIKKADELLGRMDLSGIRFLS